MPVGQSTLTWDTPKIKIFSVRAGMQAPEIEATTLDGKPFKLSELRGKVVLVDFWATWCGPCVAELPNVKKAFDKYAADGFTVVSISFDRDADTARKFAAERQLNWPQIWAEQADKGPIATQYGVGGIPATFLIGADGKVIERDLRGDQLVQAVASELKKPKTGGESAIARIVESILPAASALQLTEKPLEPENPEARAALHAALTRYRELRSYADRFCYEARVVHKESEAPEVGYLEGTLQFAAPGRLALKSDVVQLFYDGQQLVAYTPGEGEFSVMEDEAARAALRPQDDEDEDEYGGSIVDVHPLAGLLADATWKVDDVLTLACATKLEAAQRDDQAGQRVSGFLTMPGWPAGNVPFTAFINGATGLFEEFRIDATLLARASAGDHHSGAAPIERAEVLLTLSDVQVNQEAPAGAFVFNRPGVQKADQFGGFAQRSARIPLDLVSRPAPDLAGADLDGASRTLNKGPEQVALVAFWGTWSPTSPRLLKDLQRLATEFPGQLVVIGVNRNGEPGTAAVRRMLEECGVRFPQILDRDGNLGRAWHADVLPAVYLVDRGGTVVEACSQWPASAPEDLGRQLRKLLAGEALYSAEELAQRRAKAPDAEPPNGMTVVIPESAPPAARLERDGAAVDVEVSGGDVSERDLDGDGTPELVLSDGSGGLALVDLATGAAQRVTLRNVGGMRMGSLQSVAPVRMDGQLCWLCVGYTYTPEDYQQLSWVRLYAPDGEALWTFAPPVSGKRAWTRACAAAGDLNGDGRPEFAVAYTRYSEPSEAGSDSGPSSKLFILDGAGQVIALREMPESADTLYVPAKFTGPRPPLYCVSGGALEKYQLLSSGELISSGAPE